MYSMYTKGRTARAAVRLLSSCHSQQSKKEINIKIKNKKKIAKIKPKHKNITAN